MNRQYGLFPALVVVVGMTASSASAQSFSWTEAATTDWGTAGNWSPNGPPGASGTAYFIGAPFFFGPTVSGPQSVAGIVVDMTPVSGFTGFHIDGSGNSLLLGSGGLTTYAYNGTAGANLLTVSPNVTLTANQNWFVGNPTTVQADGVVSGAFAFTKAGAGTLTFTNADTLSGTVTVAGGTLLLNSGGSLLNASGYQLNNGGVLTLNDTSSASTRLATVGLTVNNGGQFNLIGNSAAGASESLGTLSLNGGAFSVAVTPGGAGTTTALNFGGFARSAGTTMDFTAVSGTLGGAATGPRVNITGLTNDATGIVGGYATVGRDWAAVGANGIKAYSGYSTVSGSSGGVPTGTNLSLTAGYTINTLGTVNLNSLRLDAGTGNFTFSNTTANGPQTLVIGSGGILGVSSGGSSRRETIGGTFILQSATSELFINVTDGATSNQLNISAQIQDGPGGSTSVIKTGSGTLQLGAPTLGSPTYTGATIINGGSITIGAQNAAALPVNTSSFVINGGGTLNLGTPGSTSMSVIDAPITLNGGTFIMGKDTLFATATSAVSSRLHYITIGAGSSSSLTATSGIVGSAANPNVLRGGDSGGVTGSFINVSGTLVIASPGNTYVGGWVIGDGGVIQLGTAGQTGMSNVLGAVTNTVMMSGSSGSGTLRLNGNDLSIGGLGGGAAAIIEDAAAGSATLTLNSAAIQSFAGVIRNGTGGGALGLTKVGTGMEILGGANTFTGALNLSGGTLQATANSAFGGGAAATLAGGTVLDLNGTTQTLASLSGAGSVVLNGGNLTVGDATSTSFTGVISGVGNLTKVGTGTLTLQGTNTNNGQLNINFGSVVVNGASGALGVSAVKLDQGTALTLDNSINFATPRIAAGSSFAVNGGSLTVTGNGAANTAVTGTGALALGAQSYSVLTLNQPSGANTTFTADSLSAGTGTLVLFRGSNLGANTIASATPGTTNIHFNTAPTLVGGGGAAGTNSVSIIPFAFGAPTPNGNGSSFVTYDANGVRLLNLATEYAANLTSGATTNANIASSIASNGETINALRISGSGQIDATNGLTIASNALMAAGGSNSGINNGTLTFGAAGSTANFLLNNDLTVSSAIAITSGLGLAKGGAGTLTLSGNNSYGGPTEILGGTLRLGSSTAIPTGSQIIINVGGALDLNGFNATLTGTTNVRGVIIGTGNITTAGNVTMTGISTYAGNTNITNGTLTLGSDNPLPAGTIVNLMAGATPGMLDLNNHNLTISGLTGSGAGTVGEVLNSPSPSVIPTLTINGPTQTITGQLGDSTAAKSSFNVAYTGTGTTTIGQANLYTGSTTISNGTVLVTANKAFGVPGSGAAVTVNSGATLQLSGNVNYSQAEAVTLSGTLASTGTTGDTWAGAINVSAGASATVSTTTMVTLGGAVTGGAGSLLNVVGAGPGGSGIVVINQMFSGSPPAVNVAAGATLQSNNSSGSFARTLTGSGTVTASATVSSGFGVVTQLGDVATFGGLLTDNGANKLSFKMSGPGTEILTGLNTYSGGGSISASTFPGATTITGGVLSISNIQNGGVASNIGASSNVASNLYFQAQGLGTTAAGTLRYTGPTASTDRLFTLDSTTAPGVSPANVINYTIDASGTGALSFTNTGAINVLTTLSSQAVAPRASLTLTGSNTGLNTLAPVLGDGVTNPVNFTVPTFLIKSGAGTWALTGNNTYTGGTTINSGILQLGAGGTTGSVVGGIVNNASLVVSRSNALTLANNISGTGSLTINGSGTITLTGTNSYQGGTSVLGGTLLVNSGTGSGNVSVASGATLGGSGTIIGGVNVAGGGHLAPGNSPGVLTVGSVTLSPTAVLDMQLNGTAAGTQYDQLAVTGSTVDVTGATLNAVLGGGYTPQQSDVLVLIDNQGSSAVAGTFFGLGEGATVHLIGYDATISYLGTGNSTPGNDVVLSNFTVAPVPEPTTILGMAILGIGGIYQFRRRRAAPSGWSGRRSRC